MSSTQNTMLEIINHILNKHPELAEAVFELSKKQIKVQPDNINSIFTKIHDDNLWGSAESVSGSGSEFAYTKNLREKLPDLFSRYNIKKILDAPCGDFNWMRFVVEQVQVEYLGADIVPQLIAINNEKYESNSVKFINLDITNGDLPDADLIICRDCLFHLSFENISKFTENFMRSNIKYILTTSHHGDLVDFNRDIDDGGFRLIDLYSEPFNFPLDSLEEIEDWIPGYPRRKMIMWSRQQLIDKFKS